VKVLKWIGIALVSLFLLVTVIGVFQPQIVRVEHSKVISAPPAEVFAVLENTREFQKWSPWAKKDTNTVYTYSGPESGKGASFTWKGNSDVGYGVWTVDNTVPNEKIDLTFKFEEYPPTPAGYVLKPEGNGTNVTWFMESDMGSSPWSKFGGIFMKMAVSKDYEQGLENLEAYMKTRPKMASTAGPKGRIEKMGVEDFAGGNALSIRGVINASEIGGALGTRYAEIGQYAKSKNLTMKGSPFAVYHTWDGKTTDMEACIWTDKADKGAGSIKGMAVPGGKVLVADYYGPYMGTEAAHFALDEWAKKNNTKLSTSPWEEYITDPMVEKDPMKVLTRIYYRIL